MLQDKKEMFSEQQAFTTVAAHDSTNVLYIGPHGDDVQRIMTLFVQVRDAVTSAGAATVQFKVYTGSSAAVVNTLLWASAAIGKADLTAGSFPVQIPLPDGLNDYVKITYTVAAAALTAGSFDAGLNWGMDKS